MTSPVRRPLTLPAGLVLLAGLLLVAAVVQGLRAARDRHQMLLPRRAVTLSIAPSTTPVVRPDTRDAVLVIRLPAPGAARLGLYQILPERTLVRWIEAGESPENAPLVLPLAGLEDGRYAVTRHTREASATTRDMDRPPEALDILGEFELRR